MVLNNLHHQNMFHNFLQEQIIEQQQNKLSGILDMDYYNNLHRVNFCSSKDSTIDFFTAFLILYSSLQFGIMIGLVFVSVFVYKPMSDNKRMTYIPEPNLDEILKKLDRYEDKYDLRDVPIGREVLENQKSDSSLDDGENSNRETNDGEDNGENNDGETNVETNVELNNEIFDKKNSYVMECTPKGNVIMRYDFDSEGFQYWSDKSIDYKYLQTVARKYVTQFCCKILYKGYEKYDDVENEYRYDDEYLDTKNNCEDENENKDETQENENKEKKTSVFATLKKNDKNTKEKSIEKIANKFTHKGKIKDFEIIVKPNIPEQKEGITFSYFKQLFSSSVDNNSNNNDQ